MPSAAGSKGLAAAAIGGGVLLVYAGATNKGLLGATQAIVGGKSPTTAPSAGLDITAAPQGASPASAPLASASEISADAVKYAGAGYAWGGAPANGAGQWDCSSFANWVCGHDLGLPIPGYSAGTYTGVSHGPPTGSWLLWGGISTVSHNASDAIPGDLCIWETHMGIALGGGQMISALNSQLGTQITTIADGAPGGELLFVRRYSIPVFGPGQKTAPTG